jgi:hypothetical protein
MSRLTTIGKILLVLVVSQIAFLVYLLVKNNTDCTHKYEVEYQMYRYTTSDFTDTFQIKDNGVTYIDNHGTQVTRFGTFSIKQNKNYK